MANAVASVLGAFFTGVEDFWVFSPAGLVSFGVWNAVVVGCFGPVASSPDGGWLGEESAQSLD